jgi:hypothetical protein
MLQKIKHWFQGKTFSRKTKGHNKYKVVCQIEIIDPNGNLQFLPFHCHIKAKDKAEAEKKGHHYIKKAFRKPTVIVKSVSETIVNPKVIR